MSKRYDVIGSPGCGKTTYLARQVQRACDKFGGGRVFVCSMTRSAAAEIRGRRIAVPESNVGTLHALAYRALSMSSARPTLVEAKHIDEWNELHPWWLLNRSAVTSGGDAGEAGFGFENAGVEDDFLGDDAILRARQLDPAQVPFSVAWSEFKYARGLSDFTDLIEDALDATVSPANMGREFGALFADEFQDLSKLEIALLNKWAERAETFVIAGDPNQAIYDWRGASGDAFSGEPAKVLGKSYRVPASVHKYAMEIISTSTTHNAYAAYEPRDKQDERGVIEEGICQRHYARLGCDEVEMASFCDELATVYDKPGSSTMVIAPCAYMLNGLENMLRKKGVPFKNHLSSRWNPLTPQKGHSISQRFMALLAVSSKHFPKRNGRLWSPAEVELWAPMMSGRKDDGTGIFNSRKKSWAISQMGEEDVDVASVLDEAIDRDSYDRMWDGDIAWSLNSMTATWRRKATFVTAVLRRIGMEKLAEFIARSREPDGLTLGTIHSVKGGEADTVYLAPDLSRAAWAEMENHSWEGRDAICRQFYVGATRARQELYVLRPSWTLKGSSDFRSFDVDVGETS